MITDERLTELIDVFRLKSAYEETALDWAGQQPSNYTESVLSALKELQQCRQKELENIKQADSIWNEIMLGRVSFVRDADGTFSIVPKKD